MRIKRSQCEGRGTEEDDGMRAHRREGQKRKKLGGGRTGEQTEKYDLLTSDC